MSSRRSHYELAFEAYLDRRGIAYVAVEEVRRFGAKDTGVKAFDYIVYPTGSKACLVDLKGRKSPISVPAKECRQKNWVTRADITGLLSWEQVFGPEYEAVFVFSYWLAAGKVSAVASAERQGDGDRFSFAGRPYSFWLVPVSAYSARAKRLSVRWDTVSVPREVFRQMSRPLAGAWPAAPC
jgi:hypothetical protein